MERIFEGNTKSPDKLMSVFEPHTEIIRKRHSKPTEFGKTVKLQEAENQIITLYQTFEEKPADTDLLVDAVSQHEEILGRRPELVAPDEDTVGEVENPESGELHISSPA